MATFTEFTNILPDPNNAIGESGQAGGTAGPGYSSVKLASEHQMMNTRTNSGRLISREVSGHKWNIDISYNPMTRDEFEPIYSFLLQKRGSLTPFFVSLPQYKAPRDTTFATFVASNTFFTLNHFQIQFPSMLQYRSPLSLGRVCCEHGLNKNLLYPFYDLRIRYAVGMQFLDIRGPKTTDSR